MGSSEEEVGPWEDMSHRGITSGFLLPPRWSSDWVRHDSTIRPSNRSTLTLAL